MLPKSHHVPDYTGYRAIVLKQHGAGIRADTLVKFTYLRSTDFGQKKPFKVKTGPSTHLVAI